MHKPQSISIICPVFNEEDSIPLFLDKVIKTKESIGINYFVELLFINNCSTDNTLQTLLKFQSEHNFIDIITLSKNFGYQKSIECGLRNSSSELTLIIDVDCEDPPEMIPEFLKLYEQGFDIVYGKRVDRVENYFLKKTRNLFYRLIKLISDDEIELYMAEFCLITSPVRTAILADNNSFPFFRGSIARVGYKRTGIPYKRHPRIHGATKYNIWGMVLFATSGILSSTTLPLRISLYLLPLFCLFTSFVALNIANDQFPNLLIYWALILGVYIFSITSFMSIYLARAYKNGLNRPNYFINFLHSSYKKNPLRSA